MGMDDRTDFRGRLAGLFRGRRATVVISAVVLAAVLVASEVIREDDLARRNQATAQQQSDQFAIFYASTVARLLESGVRTNAQLEPDAVARASGASSLYSVDGFTPGFSGGTALLERQRIDSISEDSLVIRIDRTYPEAFGGHGTLETCYAVAVPFGSQPSAPVTTIMHSCPLDPITPYPSATA
jgi:hypothetical protein